MIYKFPKCEYATTMFTVSINKGYEAESIEQKIRRMIETGEGINEEMTDNIYSARNEGVLPECDCRTDRFDIAMEGMDYVSKSHRAKRDNRIDNAIKAEEKRIADEAKIKTLIEKTE